MEIPRLSKEQLGRRLPFYTNYIIAKGGAERSWANVEVLPLNIDTFDTFLYNLRVYKNSDVYTYKVLKDVSKVSGGKT